LVSPFPPEPLCKGKRVRRHVRRSTEIKNISLSHLLRVKKYVTHSAKAVTREADPAPVSVSLSRPFHRFLKNSVWNPGPSPMTDGGIRLSKGKRDGYTTDGAPQPPLRSTVQSFGRTCFLGSTCVQLCGKSILGVMSTYVPLGWRGGTKCGTHFARR